MVTVHPGIRLSLAITALACGLAAQGLAPEILLLARIKAHTREALARLPNCSCLETVHREHQPAGGKLRALDTLRLEVLYSERREYYASPGEARFVEDHPGAFAASGTTSNGHFGLFLSEIASEHRLSYEYKGEERLRGRRLVRYDYRVPVTNSGHVINLGGSDATVGMRGSFWADPASYEIVRIYMQAEEIPPTIPVLSSETWIEYAHTNLGGSDYLLPQVAEARMVKFTGEESRNHIEFTHCRLYGAESTISFGNRQEVPLFGTSSLLERKRELLPALQIAIKVTSRITGETTVGTLIEGTVDGRVMHKGKVLIPDGSSVRGRVRRLEWYEEQGGFYVVGLEFTDIEAGPTRYRFFADLVDTDRLPGLHQSLRFTKPLETLPNGATRESGEEIVLPDLPGVGSFFVQARRLELPAGFRMKWRTRAVTP